MTIVTTSLQAEAKKLAFYLYHNIKTTHPEGITRSHKHHIVLEDVEVTRHSSMKFFCLGRSSMDLSMGLVHPASH